MTVEAKSISTSVSTSVLCGEGYLTAEVDSRSWGLNGGKTQYFKGDNCYVLVYKSENIGTLTSVVSNSTEFSKTTIKSIGYNVQREGISFSTPVASASKPLPSTVTVLNRKFVNGAGGAQYLRGFTVLRCKSWGVQLEITGARPYGFIFIEYTPDVEVWKFSGLQGDPNLLSTTVHATLYGISSASSTTNFVDL